MSRTLVVGDVHGCADELSALLKEVGFSRSDALVFVGDLVAKGPDSKGVLALAREHKARAVRGNHDDMVLRIHRGKVADPKASHKKVADSLGPEDWEFLGRTPLWMRLSKTHLVVHAGFVPGVALKNQAPVMLMNLRSIKSSGAPSTRLDGEPWASLWQGPETVLFGHDAVRGLQHHPFARGLDSGCVYGGSLTGYIIEEDRLVSVPARKAWCKPK